MILKTLLPVPPTGYLHLWCTVIGCKAQKYSSQSCMLEKTACTISRHDFGGNRLYVVFTSTASGNCNTVSLVGESTPEDDPHPPPSKVTYHPCDKGDGGFLPLSSCQTEWSITLCWFVGPDEKSFRPLSNVYCYLPLFLISSLCYFLLSNAILFHLTITEVYCIFK